MHRLMTLLAKVMAILGGIVLTALVLLTCLSVLGRTLNTMLHSDWAQSLLGGFTETLLNTGVGPILGDFELVEAGIAFSIFAFIPLCQITGGHASVDIVTNFFPDRVNRVIQMVVDIVFALVLVLIAWRLYDGMLSKMRYNETSFLIQFPVWWAYAASLFAAVISAVVGIYIAAVRTAECIGGRSLIYTAGGANH